MEGSGIFAGQSISRSLRGSSLSQRELKWNYISSIPKITMPATTVAMLR